MDVFGFSNICNKDFLLKTNHISTFVTEKLVKIWQFILFVECFLKVLRDLNRKALKVANLLKSKEDKDLIWP